MRKSVSSSAPPAPPAIFGCYALNDRPALQRDGLPLSVKYLLEVMRLFHYMVGITTPKPEDERKILFLWIAVLVGLMALGVGLVVFLVPRVMR